MGLFIFEQCYWQRVEIELFVKHSELFVWQTELFANH